MMHWSDASRRKKSDVIFLASLRNVNHRGPKSIVRPCRSDAAFAVAVAVAVVVVVIN